MSLSKLIVAELRRLGADRDAVLALTTDDTGLRSLLFGGIDGAPSASVELFDGDRYSLRLGRITVSTYALPPTEAVNGPITPDARLKGMAQNLIAQLGYLEEPLVVVERDPAAAIAQIRSTLPLREDEAISYWEVVLEIGAQPTATIARYHWSPAMAERELLPYPATFALVGRVADSLAAALGAVAE